MSIKLSFVVAVGCLLCLALGVWPTTAASGPPSAASATETAVPRIWLPIVASQAPPGQPTLNPISNAGGGASYLVSWTAAQYATSYVLQQDTTSAFTNPANVYDGPLTEWQATGQAPATYYYRVLGVNSLGSSAWSAVQSTLVNGYLTPDDALYPNQWGPAKVGAPMAWYYSSGSGVTIAVVDTGVDLNHPDLSGRVLSGYNFVDGNTNAQDDNGHGTHVAGIAAATGNNRIGVAGMAWRARILPVKVLDNNGSGYTSDIAKGIIWAVDKGARVVNLSLGSALQDPTLLSATNYAYSQGSLVTAAAGNCGNISSLASVCGGKQNPTFYPAANPNVIAVGATDSNDQVASFSNLGSYLWVSAPGVDIDSTWWSSVGGSAYQYESGTSMAAPMVSGLEALVWAAKPTLTNAEVADIIANTAVKHGAGFDPGYGYGRIDAGSAVVAAVYGVNEAGPATNARTGPLAGAQAALAASLLDNGKQPVRQATVLLKLKPTVSTQSTKQQAMRRHGVQVTDEIPELGVTIARVPPGQERKIAADLAADPDVEYAQPDYQISLLP